MSECTICSKKITYSDLYSIIEGKICNSCVSEFLDFDYEQLTKNTRDTYKLLAFINKDEVLTKIQEKRRNKANDENFVTSNVGFRLFIDETRKLWKYSVSKFKKLGLQEAESFEYSSSYKIDEINSYEVVQNNQTITSGGLGSSIVGGVLLGGAGAIVGSNVGKKTAEVKVNSLKLNIVLKSISNPIITIEYINKPLLTSSKEYDSIIEGIHKDSAVLEILLSNREANNDVGNTPSLHDKLSELKKVYDFGLINEEEYKIKRKEILDRF